MKILIASHYYPPHLGGIEIVVKNQAELLASAGNEVTVVTSKVTAEERSSKESHLEVIRVPAWNYLEKFGIPFPIFSPRVAYELFIQCKHADLVHIHDAFYISSFVAAVFGKPIVLTQHVEMIKHPSSLVMLVQRIVYATTGAIIFRLSNRIITLNDRVEQFLVDQGVDTRKLIALSNGVDLSIFYPVDAGTKTALRKKYNLSLDKKIVLFVGRFVPKKGFNTLLAAQSDEYQIVFVGGDGPVANSEKVVFLGKLPQRTVAELYQASDIFVLPSEGEGFPLSVQEAMASGLPVVTTDDSGYKRYNLDRNNIYFLDTPTESNIRCALATIIKDDAKLRAMSSYSKKYAESYFGWNDFLLNLQKIYDLLVV
jgi:glycosyltransferase involved in cell wall biosynthesis